jgi:hypothetical protein
MALADKIKNIKKEIANALSCADWVLSMMPTLSSLRLVLHAKSALAMSLCLANYSLTVSLTS